MLLLVVVVVVSVAAKGGAPFSLLRTLKAQKVKERSEKYKCAFFIMICICTIYFNEINCANTKQQ